MQFNIFVNVPDQDHIRSWVLIGSCSSLEEFQEIKEKYIEDWAGTSNVLRLRELGSFELVKDGDEIFMAEYFDAR